MENSVQMMQSIISISFSKILKCLISVGSNKKGVTLDLYCDICLLKWLLSSFVTYVVTNTDFNQFVTFCHQARCHISISSVTPGVFPIYVTTFWCYSSVTYLHISHIVTYCHILSHVTHCHISSLLQKKVPKSDKILMTLFVTIFTFVTLVSYIF